MPRYSKTLTPAAQIAFLTALRRGVLVEAAAAEVGVAVSTLYCRRRRDSLFDAAWTAAAEASAGWAFERRPGGGAGLVRTRRRLRFAGARREAFLDGLARTSNTRDSARDALVHPATVYRHIRRDPGFARANRAALARGYAFLEALAAEERAASAARWRGRVFVPAGRPPAGFETQIRILARYRRRPPRRRGAWRDRQERVPGFEETVAALERKLRWLGVR